MSNLSRILLLLICGSLLGCQTVLKTNTARVSKSTNALLEAEQAYAFAVGNPSVNLFINAVPLLEDALKQAPSSVSLQYKTYDVYYRLLSAGNEQYFDKAKEVFYQIPLAVRRELSPPSLAKLNGRYDQIKDNEQVLEALIFDMLREQPNSAEAHSELGRFIYGKKGAFTAIPFYKQALRYNPNHDPLKLELGYAYSEYVRGLNCYYENPKAVREAIRLLQTGHQIDRSSAYLSHRLSYLYSLVGMNPLSLREATMAHSKKESDTSRYRLAAAYLDNGRFDDALKHYLPLIETGEKELHLDLAEGFAIKGEWQDAAKYAQAYLDENKPRTFYSVITLEFIEHMSGQQNGVDYHELLSGLSLNSWQRALDLFWQGKSTDQELLSLSENVCESAEAEYYIGLKQFESGNHRDAKMHFERVINHKVYNFIEYGYAKELLKALSKKQG